MLYQWLRTLIHNGSTLTDYSIEAQNDSVPFELTTGQYLYIGQYYPFNNFYLDMSTVNTNASVIQIQYWNSKEWINCVDILDGTKVSGVTLGRSGVVQFSPDIDSNWTEIRDTSKQDSPAHLQGREMYNMYWLRVSFSANLSALTEVRRITYSFTSNAMLSGVDPEINQYLTPWGGSSKLNWDEQIQLASMHLVADLRARGIVLHAGNILRFDDIALACAYRTLAVIYGPLGEAFNGRRAQALEQYEKLLNVKRFTIDVDTNGRVDKGEINNTVGQMVR